jgi:hypothetical protein
MGDMVKNLLNKMDLEDITKAEILHLVADKDDYERYDLLKEVTRLLKKKKTYLIQQKHFYEKMEKQEEKEKTKEQIKKIKKLDRLVHEEMDCFTLPKKEKDLSKRTLPTFVRMQASNLNDIKCMQYLLDEDTKCLLNKIEEESSPHKKLELIESFIFKFEKLLADLQKSLNQAIEELLLKAKENGDYFPILKKKWETIMKKEKYEDFALKIDYYQISIRGIKVILERLYTLKGIQKSAIAKEERTLKRKNSDIFPDDTEFIIQSILDHSNLDEESLRKTKAASHSFLKMLPLLKKNVEVCNQIYPSLNDLTEYFLSVFEHMDNEDVICLCNIFKNNLNITVCELKDLDIDTSSIRKQLKLLTKKFNKMKKSILEEGLEENDTKYVSLFTPLLEEELNYYYFSRILEETKSDLTNKDKEELLSTILDYFIVNYKYKLVNQNFSYIDPNYYKSLLMLFIKYELITPDMEQMLKQRLEEFQDYLYSKGKNLSSSKSEALTDIENLSSSLLKYKKEYQNLNCLSEKLGQIIKEKIPYIVSNSEKLGYSSVGEKYDSSTFVLGKYAYSKAYNEEGDLLFQIHLLDTASLITKQEGIDEYLKENTVEKLPIHFQYEEGKKYPVMTFQFHIYQSHIVSNMKLFPNIIKIDSIYSLEEFQQYRNYPDLKALVSAYKQIEPIDDLSIDRYTEKILSTHILKFFNGFEKEIPMMYKRNCDNLYEQLMVQNHNQLCGELFHIPKKQAHRIFNILDEKPADIYTNYQTEDAYLSIEPFSYSGIYLLRTIKALLNETYSFHEEEYNIEKANVISYCKKKNELYGYVPNKIMKQDKNRCIDKQ